MRISDWSSDVCSSDLIVQDLCLTSQRSEQAHRDDQRHHELHQTNPDIAQSGIEGQGAAFFRLGEEEADIRHRRGEVPSAKTAQQRKDEKYQIRRVRSEEHTSELQSLMRISYAVFCLKKKKTTQIPHITTYTNKEKNINI